MTRGRAATARWLMRRLIEWCRRRLDTIYGDVLEENTNMLELARGLGFRVFDSKDEGRSAASSLPLAATRAADPSVQ